MSHRISNLGQLVSLPSFSVRRPVTITMIFLAVTLLGILASRRLPVELFPSLDYPQLTILTRYPAASPREIESLVTRTIEDAASSTPGIRRITSISRDGVSIVTADCAWGTSVTEVSLQLHETIELVKEQLPREADAPLVLTYNPFDQPLMVLGVTSRLPVEAQHAFITETLAEHLQRVPGVGHVAVAGLPEPEIRVAVDQHRLSAAHRSLRDVVRAIEQTNVNYPAGSMAQDTFDYVVRTTAAYTAVDDMAHTIVQPADMAPTRASPQMAAAQPSSTTHLVQLGHVSSITSTFRPPANYARLNSASQVILTITKQSGANTRSVSRAVHATVQRLQPLLQQQRAEITVLDDQSWFITNAIRGVCLAVIVGGLLAFLVLTWALCDWRSALIVSLAIPVAVLITLIVMYVCGVSLNMISLGGLALGVGMLVDNAIVVVESVHRERSQQQTQGTHTILQGTQRVHRALSAGTLTTIIVFLPVLFVDGIAGRLFRDLAFTVTVSLLASWVVALSLVPRCLLAVSHVATQSTPRLLRRVHAHYRVWLSWCMAHRQVMLRGLCLVGVISMLLVCTLPRVLFPTATQRALTVLLTLPAGTHLDITRQAAIQLEQHLQALSGVQQVVTRVGPSAAELGIDLADLAPSEAQLDITLRRTRHTRTVRRRLAQLTPQALRGGRVSFPDTHDPLASTLGRGGQFRVELSSDDWDVLQAVAPRVQALVERVHGLRNVRSDLESTTPETTISIRKDRAFSHGLTVRDIADTARIALAGRTAGRLESGSQRQNIRVVLREEDRARMTHLGQLLIHTPLGITIPLKDVATIMEARGPSAITRVEQQRTITVTAQRAGRQPAAVTAAVQQAVMQMSPALPSTVHMRIRGESEETRRTFRSLGGALVLALLLVYMVLAAQFESLTQPCWVLLAVPLALIGVAGVLVITWTPLSVMVLLGCIVLGGVVVNNGILLLTEFQAALLVLGQGASRAQAARRAAQRRFRPIVLTTMTTVLGLLPLALGLGDGAALRTPLAFTVIGGLLGSSVLLLVVLPSLIAMPRPWTPRRLRCSPTIPVRAIRQRSQAERPI